MLRKKTNLLLELFLEFHKSLTSGANLFVATGSIDCHIMCMHTNLPCVLAPLTNVHSPTNAHSPTNISFIVFETIVHSILATEIHW